MACSSNMHIGHINFKYAHVQYFINPFLKYTIYLNYSCTSNESKYFRSDNTNACRNNVHVNVYVQQCSALSEAD